MIDTALLFAQTLATAGAAGWMFTGVRDNILYPTQNETYTAEVMEMRRIQEEFPEAFEPVKHRPITSRALQLLAFRVVVIVEALACLLLIAGTCALALALVGVMEASTARAVAMVGAVVFMSVWAGMLVVGNHFSYWFCHEGTQMTHYHMNMWGLGLIILLAQG